LYVRLFPTSIFVPDYDADPSVGKYN